MGAADVVPGVSGGTIAFITGIYEELISSIRSVNLKALKILFSQGPAAFWNHINGWFLVSLFGGIGISVVSLAKIILFLLHNHAVLLWSFFFGLIIASAVLVSRTVNKWSASSIVSLLVGGVIAYFISVATPSETPDEYWFVFISGMIAICAMILPGISGSFILLLLKKYEFVTTAISEANVVVIAVFGAGAAIGLAAFSNVLNWLFKKFHDQTIALLSGFMIGSLNVVWPWKNVLEWRINSKGEEVPVIYESVSPWNFEGENNLLLACVLIVVGVLVIWAVDFLGGKTKSTTNG